MGIKDWLDSTSLVASARNFMSGQKAKIQSFETSEGGLDNIDLENALYINNTNRGIGGIKNTYKTYAEQITETYKKYNGEADWGNQQTRAILDIRSAFISGAGLSVASTNDQFNNWYTKFIAKNKVLGSRFFDSVLGTEITGKCLLTLKPVIGEYPSVLRIPYAIDNLYSVKLASKYDPDSIVDITVQKDGKEKSLGLQNFVYIRTGGDDTEVNKTTTRTGLILNEAENYDRATKDLRLTNHVVSRITPVFKTASTKETNEVTTNLKKTAWRIGKAFVGTADFKYTSPGTGSVDNLKSEMASAIKTMASVTGCPVHWIGWTDLMANRSTADSLYATLKNATIRERSIISDGIYELLIKAQEVYIDSGGTDITEVYRDFSVAIPIVDISNFLDMVKGMSLAFSDGVISKSDYQNNLPGIDAQKTNKALQLEGQSGLVEKKSTQDTNTVDTV